MATHRRHLFDSLVQQATWCNVLYWRTCNVAIGVMVESQPKLLKVEVAMAR